MKSRFPFAVMLALVPALAGCAGKAPQPAVTPVIASDIDRQSFTGTWRGDVDSADPRFAGTVEFRFQDGGAVILPTRPVPSRILWVRLTGNKLTGALEPYFDPERASEVYTTFDGTLSYGLLRGTLHERTNMQWKDSATWTVARVVE